MEVIYEKKFVSTILIISILSTGLLSGCGKAHRLNP